MRVLILVGFYLFSGVSYAGNTEEKINGEGLCLLEESWFGEGDYKIFLNFACVQSGDEGFIEIFDAEVSKIFAEQQCREICGSNYQETIVSVSIDEIEDDPFIQDPVINRIAADESEQLDDDESYVQDNLDNSYSESEL